MSSLPVWVLALGIGWLATPGRRDRLPWAAWLLGVEAGVRFASLGAAFWFPLGPPPWLAAPLLGWLLWLVSGRRLGRALALGLVGAALVAPLTGRWGGRDRLTWEGPAAGADLGHLALLGLVIAYDAAMVARWLLSGGTSSPSSRARPRPPPARTPRRPTAPTPPG